MLLVFIGVVAALILFDLYRGKVSVRNGHYTLTDEPSMFWINILIRLGIALVFIMLYFRKKNN